MAEAKLLTIKRRADFLRVRGGARCATAAFVLEAKPRSATTADDGPRFGFTVTKKLGGAVVRNRLRRRLKSAVREVALPLARKGHDYVIVAREPSGTLSYQDLTGLLADAMARLDRPIKANGMAPSARRASRT